MSWRLVPSGPALSGPSTCKARGRLARGPQRSGVRPSHLLAAGLLALSMATAVTGTAVAADLSGATEYGSPYDDPRYADIYRHPPHRPEVYRDSYKVDAPRRHADDDDDDDVRYTRRADRDYLPPMRPDPRYAEPRHGRHNGDCVPRELIRDRLSADGWRDFHDVTIDGDVAILSARRPSGRLFELEIHRCSGEIVEARPQRSHAYGRRRFPSRS